MNGVAVLTERLLSECPGLRIIVTSRVRLALALERVHRLEGLSPGRDGDAVTLFVERATAAGSETPSTSDLDRIEWRCAARSTVSASAVELAAVQSPSLGLDGMERALLDQERLLVGGAGSSPASGPCMRPSTGASPCSSLRPPASCFAWPYSPPRSAWRQPRRWWGSHRWPLRRSRCSATLVEHNLAATTTGSMGDLVFRLLGAGPAVRPRQDDPGQTRLRLLSTCCGAWRPSRRPGPAISRTPSTTW